MLMCVWVGGYIYIYNFVALLHITAEFMGKTERLHVFICIYCKNCSTADDALERAGTINCIS